MGGWLAAKSLDGVAIRMAITRKKYNGAERDAGTYQLGKEEPRRLVGQRIGLKAERRRAGEQPVHDHHIARVNGCKELSLRTTHPRTSKEGIRFQTSCKRLDHKSASRAAEHVRREIGPGKLS